MKMAIVEIERRGCRIGSCKARLNLGFYLVFGKEVLSGPFKTSLSAHKSKKEWVMPGEKVQAY